MNDLCPFCAKPIQREYGSFRCKHCAKSSEDLIDLERKTRAAEVRRVARAELAQKKAGEAAKALGDAKRQAVALAVARHIAKKKAASSDPDGPREARATAKASRLAVAAASGTAKKRPKL